MLRFKVEPQDILKLETDLIVVAMFKDLIPLKGHAGNLDWILSGKISKLIKSQKVFGIFKEIVLLSTPSKVRAKVLLVGCGKTKNLNYSKLLNLYSYLVKTLNHIDVKDFAISLDFAIPFETEEYKKRSVAIIEGLIRGFDAIDSKSDEYVIRVGEKDSSRLSLLKDTIHDSLKNTNWKTMAVLESG